MVGSRGSRGSTPGSSIPQYGDHMLELSTWTFIWAIGYVLYPKSVYRPYVLSVACLFVAAMATVAGTNNISSYIYLLVVHFAPVAMCLAHGPATSNTEGIVAQLFLAIVWFIATNAHDVRRRSVFHYYTMMRGDAPTPCTARYVDDAK